MLKSQKINNHAENEEGFSIDKATLGRISRTTLMIPSFSKSKQRNKKSKDIIL